MALLAPIFTAAEAVQRGQQTVILDHPDAAVRLFATAVDREYGKNGETAYAGVHAPARLRTCTCTQMHYAPKILARAFVVPVEQMTHRERGGRDVK